MCDPKKKTNTSGHGFVEGSLKGHSRQDDWLQSFSLIVHIGSLIKDRSEKNWTYP